MGNELPHGCRVFPAIGGGYGAKVRDGRGRDELTLGPFPDKQQAVKAAKEAWSNGRMSDEETD